MSGHRVEVMEIASHVQVKVIFYSCIIFEPVTDCSKISHSHPHTLTLTASSVKWNTKGNYGSSTHTHTNEHTYTHTPNTVSGHPHNHRLNTFHIHTKYNYIKAVMGTKAKTITYIMVWNTTEACEWWGKERVRTIWQAAALMWINKHDGNTQ